MLQHPDLILAICAVVSLLGAFFAWIMSVILAPIKVLIKDNTQAMERIAQIVDDHASKLEDHGVRLTKIETKHAERHGP